MICIALLNWNGYDDTAECLESLAASTYDDYFIVLGDNGSQDGSLDRLQELCSTRGDTVHRTRLGEETFPVPERRCVILYDLLENNGFSRANNMMVRYAAHYSPEYFLLLNNDTVLEPDSLSRLVNFQKQRPRYLIITPLIHYYRDRDKIWNGGGRIRWGLRKYWYKDMPASRVREKEFIECSFITGCCMMFTPDVLDSDGAIFTERFFYGEEDFELALRMKRRKVRMACVTGSVIYHKVSASVNRHYTKAGPVYIHYLNRLIDVRNFMPELSYSFFRLYLCATLAMYLRKAFHYSPGQSMKFLRQLCRDAAGRSSVPKEYCLKIFMEGAPVDI